MTKKKQNRVIKLDKKTMSVADINKIMELTKQLGNSLEKGAMNNILPIIDKCDELDYSGHMYLSDMVIRLQRNANSAVMVMEILKDILVCMIREEEYILKQLQRENYILTKVRDDGNEQV